MSTAPVRVAICDDSRAYGVGLGRFLETDRHLEVVMIATSAEQLLGELGNVRPDLITMDLELPGIDGVEAIRRIVAATAIPIVVITTHTGGGLIAAALTAGALDAFAKSDVRLDRRLSPHGVALRRRLVRIARYGDQAPAGVPASASNPASPPSAPPAAPARSPGRLPRRGVATHVGVAASAGGPAALAEVLGALPADYGLPVLVVQHISAGFAAGLASWLDGVIAVPVRLASEGEPAGRGVAIAPDGAHLLLGHDGRLRLDQRATPGGHCPSADALLRSLAAAAGPGAVAVVLTGMGRDGAAGVAAVRAAGGVALAECSERAQMAGMPAAATEAGATALERAEIGHQLAALWRAARP